MAQNQGLPTPGYQLVDGSGKISPIWYQFLSSLWQRTGGGSNTGNVQSVSVSPGDGIIASVENPTTTPSINLTLGAITPASVDASGTVAGHAGYFSSGLTNLGNTQFGTYTAGVLSQIGYITITDVNGNTIKLMVGS